MVNTVEKVENMVDGSVDNMLDALEADTTTPFQGIWKKGILVQIQGGVWSMEAKLQASDIGKESTDIPEFVFLGKKRLFSTKEKNRFLNIVSRARNAAERSGFPFFITGSFFVPFANYDRVKDSVEAERVKFFRLVDEFIERYDERRSEFLETHDSHRALLETHYPDPESVRNMFKFNVVYYMASLSGGITGDASGEALYLQWAIESMNSLREEARVVSDAIREASVGQNLDGRTMRRVQTLVDRLTNMDLMGDTKLRDAALALSVSPTPERAIALKQVATDVTEDDVRAILLD